MKSYLVWVLVRKATVPLIQNRQAKAFAWRVFLRMQNADRSLLKETKSAYIDQPIILIKLGRIPGVSGLVSANATSHLTILRFNNLIK